jgi:glutamate-ammonia-ligase adenylyltransferase
LLLFWLHSERAEALHGWLRELGYLDTEAVLALLASFVNHAQVRRLSEAAATRLQKLLASLLAETVVYPQPAALLARILDTLRALAGRTVYIDLLLEYPGVRTHMLQLCAASDWFAQQLASTPLLLDAMLDSASFYRKSQHAELEQSLHYLLSAVDADLEQQMERLRQFKHAEQLKLAAQDVSGKVDVMDVGDVLSDIAAVVLKTTLALAWQSTAAVHGEPVCGAPEARYRPRMAVIGYGKLGGRELGYSSDLDIVFIHNGVAENAYTDGDKVIDNSNFFARVAQRVLHILGTRTYAGLLYETDTRLRPDGRAGLMVSSTAGFEDYQRNKAWTWEHQALVRARVVAGDAPVREEFARIRHAVLARQRSAQTLLSEVLAMRLKMRDHLASGAVDAVNLKQDAGGIVDIEFIAQAGVLLHAAHHATLLSSTSTLQLLRILGGTGWLRAHEVAALASAYTCYRGQLNREALQIADAAADASNISGHRDAVSAVWERVFAGLVPAQL